MEWVTFPFPRGSSQPRDEPGAPTLQWILCQLSHKGSPRILEWAAYPFYSRSSWPRNWTHVSGLAGRFLTTEPPGKPSHCTRAQPTSIWSILTLLYLQRPYFQTRSYSKVSGAWVRTSIYFFSRIQPILFCEICYYLLEFFLTTTSL